MVVIQYLLFNYSKENHFTEKSSNMTVFWRRLSPMISCGPLARAKFWFVRFLSVVKDRTSAQLAIEESKDSHLSVQHICSNIHKPVENCKRKKLSQIIAGFSTPPNIAPKLVLFGAPPFLSLLLLYSAFGSVSRSSPKITKTKKKYLKFSSYLCPTRSLIFTIFHTTGTALSTQPIRRTMSVSSLALALPIHWSNNAPNCWKWCR